MSFLGLTRSDVMEWVQEKSSRLHWPNKRIWTALIALSLITFLYLSVDTSRYTSSLGGHNWSQYAYASYATNDDSLCNSLMLFETLERLGSRPDRVLLYPSTWNIDGSGTSENGAALLRKLQAHKVKLTPITIQEYHDVDPTWSKGFTKLLAFNQTQYSRVLSLDSDATILQPMDELFRLPPAPIAMPYAYWLEKEHELNAQIILFTPSSAEYARVEQAYLDRPTGNTEMDMLNDMYRESCMVLPHRPYGLLTGEFKAGDHVKYMGSNEWNPKAVLKEAKFIHFSDWPLPKPWQSITQSQWDNVFPPCAEGQDCTSREVWLSVYRDFLRRRRDVCGEAFMPPTTVPTR